MEHRWGKRVFMIPVTEDDPVVERSRSLWVETSQEISEVVSGTTFT